MDSLYLDNVLQEVMVNTFGQLAFTARLFSGSEVRQKSVSCDGSLHFHMVVCQLCISHSTSMRTNVNLVDQWHRVA